MAQRSSRPVVAVAFVAVAGLLGASCGGGGNGSAGTTTPGQATTVGTGTPGTVTGGTEATATSTATTEPAAAPKPGGSLVFAVEADTGSPWRPFEMQCASSCYQVVSSVYDALVVTTDDGGWKPYLAESLTPNADYTVWTIKVRPGITFHDGTPLDGAAVADNLNRARTGFLTGAQLADVTDISVDPSDAMAVDVTIKRPWTSFPLALIGQVGMIASPTWLAASDHDGALKAKPVGTGPFVFDDYKPNEFFKAKRNPNYWNKPYPYLDAIEFRPIADALQRADALLSGAVDVIQTTNGETIAKYRDSKDIRLEERTYKGSTSYLLLHVTQTLADGTASPIDDQRVRCALANSVDYQTVLDTIDYGVDKLANGPFSPQQAGYLDDTGYPEKQDMDKAKALIADYKKDHPGRLALSLATTQDATNLAIAQFQQQWYEEAGADEVTINQYDQAQYILIALQGSFQMFQWRNHSGVDMDTQYIWWHSSSAAPVGQLALNFGRIRDAVIDQALDANRGEADPAKKQEYAETVNKRFGEQCYDLWGSWTTWGLLAKPDVLWPDKRALPDGSETAPTNEILDVRTVWRAA